LALRIGELVLDAGHCFERVKSIAIIQLAQISRACFPAVRVLESKKMGAR